MAIAGWTKYAEYCWWCAAKAATITYWGDSVTGEWISSCRCPVCSGYGYTQCSQHNRISHTRATLIHSYKSQLTTEIYFTWEYVNVPLKGYTKLLVPHRRTYKNVWDSFYCYKSFYTSGSLTCYYVPTSSYYKTLYKG